MYDTSFTNVNPSASALLVIKRTSTSYFRAAFPHPPTSRQGFPAGCQPISFSTTAGPLYAHYRDTFDRLFSYPFATNTQECSSATDSLVGRELRRSRVLAPYQFDGTDLVYSCTTRGLKRVCLDRCRFRRICSESGIRSTGRVYAAEDGSWHLLAKLVLGQYSAEMFFGEVAGNIMYRDSEHSCTRSDDCFE